MGFSNNERHLELVSRGVSRGFSENQRHLKLVCDPGYKVMSLICLKLGEKAVISEERVDCSFYYYAHFYRLSLGLFFL